jgi:hypothetical protein
MNFYLLIINVQMNYVDIILFHKYHVCVWRILKNINLQNLKRASAFIDIGTVFYNN